MVPYMAPTAVALTTSPTSYLSTPMLPGAIMQEVVNRPTLSVPKFSGNTLSVSKFSGNTPSSSNPIKFTEKGMVIGSKTIPSVSGPISTTYLVSEGRPAVLLFGDEHQSRERMCHDPSKTISEFVSAVNSEIGSPAHPVDMYTETSIIGTGYGVNNGAKGGPMQDFTEGNVLDCYTESGSCPLGHTVRGHAIDARQAGTDLVKVSQLTPSQLEKYESLPASFRENANFEYKLHKMLSHYRNLFKFDSSIVKGTKEYKPKRKAFKNDLAQFKKILLTTEFNTDGTVETATANLKTFLNPIVEGNYDEFSENLFKALTSNPEKSSVLDNVKDSGIESSVWQEQYKTMLMEDKYNSHYGKNNKPFQHIEEIIKVADDPTAFQMSDYGDDMEGYEQASGRLQLKITAPFLDMAIAGKIISNPDSALNIGYMGESHVSSIANLLNRVGGYEKVGSIPQTNQFQPSRCQTYSGITVNSDYTMPIFYK